MISNWRNADDRGSTVVNREPLGFLLGAAGRKVAKVYTAALAEDVVSPSQLYVLRQLWREDGLALVDVRERAQLDATSMTWIADQLEKVGLVERKRNDPDRRIVRLWLTDSGRALASDLESRLASWDAGIESVLRQHHAPADLDTFRSVLSTIVATLPEGDDLWASLSTSWDEALERLRRSVLDVPEHAVEGEPEP